MKRERKEKEGECEREERGPGDEKREKRRKMGRCRCRCHQGCHKWSSELGLRCCVDLTPLIAPELSRPAPKAGDTHRMYVMTPMLLQRTVMSELCGSTLKPTGPRSHFLPQVSPE